MEIKVISYNGNPRKNQIFKAVGILNAVQNYFFFKLVDTPNDICDNNILDWEKFCKTQCNNINGGYLIYITNKKFDDNWFSHEEHQYSVISTYDWEELFAPPSLKAYLVYQIAQSAINFRADLRENMSRRICHNYAVGCMFDFCKDKTDIKFGMVSGIICPQCRGSLSQYGVDENVLKSIERILDYVRSEAIGKSIELNENEAFIAMRFSINDENDNAYKYGIKGALYELGIKSFRADDEIISGQLLEKVKLSIEKSRFVIAKIDSQNLNVYFELGLALGLGKDVLLISKKDLVLQLPSDLRNWECLTYTEGNYDELKNKIKKYYCDNYHYLETVSMI